MEGPKNAAKDDATPEERAADRKRNFAKAVEAKLLSAAPPDIANCTSMPIKLVVTWLACNTCRLCTEVFCYRPDKRNERFAATGSDTDCSPTEDSATRQKRIRKESEQRRQFLEEHEKEHPECLFMRFPGNIIINGDRTFYLPGLPHTLEEVQEVVNVAAAKVLGSRKSVRSYFWRATSRSSIRKMIKGRTDTEYLESLLATDNFRTNLDKLAGKAVEDAPFCFKYPAKSTRKRSRFSYVHSQPIAAWKERLMGPKFTSLASAPLQMGRFRGAGKLAYRSETVQSSASPIICRDGSQVRDTAPTLARPDITTISDSSDEDSDVPLARSQPPRKMFKSEHVNMHSGGEGAALVSITVEPPLFAPAPELVPSRSSPVVCTPHLPSVLLDNPGESQPIGDTDGRLDLFMAPKQCTPPAGLDDETPLISAIKAHTNLDRPEHIKEAINLLEQAGLTWTFISNPKIVKNTWDATMVDVKVIWKELRGKSSLTLGDLNSFADMGRALRPDWM